MQTHTMPTPLGPLAHFGAPLSRESEARWARKIPTTCLIFVHGFGGRAVATWGDLADMAMEHPSFTAMDLIFLGYESRSRTAAYNVGVLYQALSAFAERPTEILKAVGGPERAQEFSYERIVLIGHSLGGALVRDVAMCAKLQECAWAERLQLALFAPAHLGANILKLLAMGFGFLKWLPPAKAAAALACPVLEDLEANSPYMMRLLQTAEKIGVHCTTKAKIVVHASGDRIVSQNTFFSDPPPVPYPDSDHIRCCKPIKMRFDLPLRDIARGAS